MSYDQQATIHSLCHSFAPSPPRMPEPFDFLVPSLHSSKRSSRDSSPGPSCGSPTPSRISSSGCKTPPQSSASRLEEATESYCATSLGPPSSPQDGRQPKRVHTSACSAGYQGLNPGHGSFRHRRPADIWTAVSPEKTLQQTGLPGHGPKAPASTKLRLSRSQRSRLNPPSTLRALVAVTLSAALVYHLFVYFLCPGLGGLTFNCSSDSSSSQLVSWLISPPCRQHHEVTPAISEPQRDTLALYRILGNDLPPRHAVNQTMENLRFLLEHELDVAQTVVLDPDVSPSILHIDKFFVLNRIANPDTLQGIRKLLFDYGVSEDHIIDIPFEWEEYAKLAPRWDGGVANVADVWGLRPAQFGAAETQLQRVADELPLLNATLAASTEDALGAPVSAKRRRAELIGRLRALDYTFHDKNLYAMNNNGGRNVALRHGRSLPRARWILPLDGNCFFTPPAFRSLIESLEDAEASGNDQHHVVIPMARLLDNQAILHTNTLDFLDAEFEAPPAPEEPQVGFRYDSTELFQEAMRYGRRSKLEFLWRLGAVPRSRKLDSRTLPWEASDRAYLTSSTYQSIGQSDGSDQRGGYTTAGWVYRLFSGQRDQEVTSPIANSLRNMNRIKGIVSYLEDLDEDLTRGRLCQGLPDRCGFAATRTNGVEMGEQQTFKERYHSGNSTALFEVAVLEADVADPEKWGSDAQARLAHSFKMSVLAFTKDDVKLARQAADLIISTLTPTLDFFQQSDAVMRSLVERGLSPYDSEGYAFPMLPPSRYSGNNGADWSLLLHPEASLNSITVAIDPLTLDPLPAMDALRLLRAVDIQMAPVMSRLKRLFSIQLAHLLQPNTVKAVSLKPLGDMRAYDLKVAGLAAFLDDVRLLNRIRSRAHLRSPDNTVDPALLHLLKNAGALD